MINHNKYQDVWVHQLQIKGNRECEHRFQCIKNYLRKFKGQPLKILDFGANNGYFSFRIAEEFPAFDIYAVEYSSLISSLIKLNQLENVFLIQKYMNEDELINFIKEEDFDLILMMSVLHHFKNPEKIIDFLSQRHNRTIFEVSYPDERTVSNPEKIFPIWKYLQSKNAVQINSWIPNERPIYYVNSNEIILHGKVHNGCGSAGKTIGYDISYGLFEKLFKIFYPGTLNIKLDYEIEFKNLTTINTYYKVFPVMINGILMWSILTEEKGFRTKELEIISEYKLRELFNYTNDKKIQLAVNKRFIRRQGE